MSLTVKYLDAPEGAQDAAQDSFTSGQPFSVSCLDEVPDTPWATLEPGVWKLDGSRQLLSSAPYGTVGGFWSIERSGDDGTFSTPPTISIEFPEPYTATGLTFTFWPSTDQWCSKIKVSWYSGNVLITEVTACPGSAEWTLAQLAEGFDKIVVELIATNQPGHFAKLQRIMIGQVTIFGKEELVNVRLLNEVDPSLCTLPVDTMQVEIHDRSNRAFAPQENQKMELYRDGKLMACHYIKSGTRMERNYYSFSCQSAVGLLEDNFLSGGIYSGYPAVQLIADILGDWKFVVDDAFADATVAGYIPLCTKREALQQVAIAIGAIITTQESDAIRFIPFPDAVSSEFTRDKIFAGAKVETGAKIARYEVAAYRLIMSTEETETLIDGEEVDGEDILFTFGGLYHGYRITGGTITGNGVDWVTITANGVVTLSADKATERVTMYTRRNPAATAAERNNVLTVEGVRLIHSGNAGAVLDRLYAVGQNRQTLTQEAVIDTQRAGDLVTSVNPWGTYTTGYITAMDSTLTQNGHTAEVTILGMEVVG